MHRFLDTVLWEFIQNLPVIVFFVAAVWLWAQRSRGKAVGCVVTGSLIGSLVIRFTEKMADGGREPLSVTLVNIVALSVMQVLFVAYLSTDVRWSRPRTDLIMGAVAGAILAVAQGLAAPGALLIGVILHSVALALSGALVLIGIRTLRDRKFFHATMVSVLIALAMTVLISIVDYSYLWLI